MQGLRVSVTHKPRKSKSWLKQFKFLLNNPKLKAASIDFNQNVRFIYVKKSLEALLKRARFQNHIFTALDVGAGLGTLSNYLSQELGCSIINVEVNSTHKLANLVVADGSRLPFKDNSFDFAVSSDVLEHIKQDDRVNFLEELLRCCRFGVIVTYSKLHKNNPSASGIKIFEKLCRKHPDWYLEHNRNIIVDDAALKNASNRNGAKIVELKPLTGIFSLFFTGAQYLIHVHALSFFFNITAYLFTRLIDPPPYYAFGLITTKRNFSEAHKT